MSTSESDINSTKRKHWTSEEDSAIISLVSGKQSYTWTDIARMLAEDYGLPGRSSKQCRERWHNHLDPGLKKAKWTPEELLALFSAHCEHGNKWTKIKNFLPGRSENCVKNQFYSCLRRQFRKWKGHDAQRHQLHKYSRILVSQLISNLKKKTLKGDQEKTLADIDPVTDPNEESDEYIRMIDIEFSPLYFPEMLLINDY